MALVAGAIAGSISLVGFGVDSFIEVTSGAALLWRMSVDAEDPESGMKGSVSELWVLAFWPYPPTSLTSPSLT